MQLPPLFSSESQLACVDVAFPFCFRDTPAQYDTILPQQKPKRSSYIIWSSLNKGQNLDFLAFVLPFQNIIQQIDGVTASQTAKTKSLVHGNTPTQMTKLGTNIRPPVNILNLVSYTQVQAQNVLKRVFSNAFLSE